MLTDKKKNTAPVIEVHLPASAIEHTVLQTTHPEFELVRKEVFRTLRRQLATSADLYDSTADMASFHVAEEHDGMLVTTLYQAAENSRYLMRYLDI